MGFDHLLRPLDELSGGLLSRAAGHVMRQITAVTQYHDCMAPFWEVVAVSIFGLVFAIMLLTCYAMLGYQLVLLGFKWLAWVIRSLCTVATGLMIFYILAPFAQLCKSYHTKPNPRPDDGPVSQIPAPRSVR